MFRFGHCSDSLPVKARGGNFGHGKGKVQREIDSCDDCGDTLALTPLLTADNERAK
jgi:hypothetical protein